MNSFTVLEYNEILLEIKFLPNRLGLIHLLNINISKYICISKKRETVGPIVKNFPLRR